MEIAFETWNLCGIENTKTEVATSPAENLYTFWGYTYSTTNPHNVLSDLTLEKEEMVSKHGNPNLAMGPHATDLYWVKKCTKQRDDLQS
jgi:hypothetical protein